MSDLSRHIAQRLRSRPEAEHQSFLDSTCGDDAALRDEVLGHAAEWQDAERSPAEPGVAPERASAATVISTCPGGMLEGPGTVIGAYKILELIGEGGFGYVFMAQQTHPVRRRVALKIVKPGMDSKQVIGRFEGERQALAMMDHPNIAKVFDAGTTPTGRPYFVMELVKGQEITAYCDESRLSTRERVELCIDVCHAVQHAHHKGIVHRDLKPSNVLISLHDDKPVVKVIDFGIAKAMNQDLTEGTVFTEFRQVIGTPEYMSPEQAAMSGLDVDSRTDIYSLGVLLYELISGTSPFDATDLRSAGVAEIQRIIKEYEPGRPSTRVGRSCARKSTSSTSSTGKVSTSTTSLDVARKRRTDPSTLRRLLAGDLDWVCMKAMEKDRRRRYDTGSAMADDLRRHLNFEPILARPPSNVYRLRKFVRRNRVGVGAIGGLVCALLLAMAVLAYGLAAVRHERDKTAERETETRAKMLLSSMNAVRQYTAQHVRPALVSASIDGAADTTAAAADYNADFAKEMVPGFSARQVFLNFRDAKVGGEAPADSPYKQFVYKEASPNPTNRDNLADEFEEALVEEFAKNPTVMEKSGIREVRGVRTYYIARPMPIRDAKCLDCHTTPEKAPPKQVEMYGADGWKGGYGWKLNDMIAAQMVYVPVSEAFQAEHGLGVRIFGGAVALCLIGGLVSLLLLLRRA